MSPPAHARHVMHHVNVGHKQLADYRSMLVPGLYEQIEDAARGLAGCRVLHLSATAFGGGVAEVLYTLLPLLSDVGIAPTWGILYGDAHFWEVTKRLHNSLQGAPDELDEQQVATWREHQEINAALFDPNDYDIIIAHDPQALGLLGHHLGSSARWAWRCHIDMSTPNPRALELVMPELLRYPMAIFHRREFVPGAYARGGGDARVVAPAIDPLSPKNMALSAYDARYIVHQFGLDAMRPLLTQVSRFDPWKDPLGVIDVFRLVREQQPDAQLALIGSIAHDDPEGMHCLEATVAHAANDPDIHILSNLNNVGGVEVNAFQVVSDVVLQKSLREGFGLTVAEALWKSRPVVAGDAGGIRSQITDGVSGFLVANVEEAAQRCLQLLDEPDLADDMARAGKEHVRRNFLLPRYLLDHLHIYRDLLDMAPAVTAPATKATPN